MVEMALILPMFILLTVALFDVGRAFYQYNAIAGAVRYGARFGSVIGGQCGSVDGFSDPSTADWCRQFVSGTTYFWSASGNAPVQGAGTNCPTSLDSSSSYYTVGNFVSSSSTTIVGAIAQHLDTNSSSNDVVLGPLAPGLDLSQLKVCIQLPALAGSDRTYHAGYHLRVFAYYTFQPISTLLINHSFNMIASSSYILE